MNKKRILKIIGIILLIIIIAFLIHTIRNYTIITNLQNKISKYSNITNYYTKSIINEDNGKTTKIEYYTKDNKQAVFLERNISGEIDKISMYNNGERKNTFIESKDDKIVQLNTPSIISVNIYNNLEADNSWQTLLGSISSKVTTKKYNGKEYYEIGGFISLNSLSFNGAKALIEKETGLLYKTIEDGIETQKEYEFNNVEDLIFVEPDINQYILK